MIKLIVLLTIVLSSAPAVAQDCVHPFLVHGPDGGVWIDCVETSPALSKLHTFAQIVLAGANGFDTGESVYNKAVKGSAITEVNPLLAPLANRPGLFALTKAAETAALEAYLDKLFHTHPKLAVVLEFGVSGAFVTAGVHNSHLR